MTLNLTVVEPDGRAAWAARIGEVWGGALVAVLATGQALIEAKDALAHGEFEAMVEADLPFGTSTARRLMKIANNGRLSNRAHGHVLPPSWRTLYELSKLDGATFDRALAEGRIRPDMERQQAVVLRTGERRIARLAKAEALAAQAAPLATALAGRRYPVVYADPPWPHKTFSEAGKRKSPENHYPPMSLDDIAALPVGEVAAERAVLWLWTTVGHLVNAGGMMAAWGFAYKSHVVWRKTYKNGQPRRGTGYWFINTHELLLLGVRGDIPAPVMGTQAESVIDAPVGRHSEKPALFRQMIKDYFPNVGRIELFARQQVAGWDAWGNEVGVSPASRSPPEGRP